MTRLSGRRFRRWWRALTLAQVVVILATVGAQTAVLYPVISRAQERSRASVCQYNLKRLAVAAMMYMDDWDSRLPSSASSTSSGSPTQQQVISYLTGKPAGSAVSWSTILLPYYKDQELAFCPSDTTRATASYWWKYATDLAWRQLGLRREADYAYPGSQILLYEHSPWHYGGASGLMNRSILNVAYMDSHVARVSIENGPAGLPSPADEASGAAAIRPGAPMYFNYDHAAGTHHPGVADYVDPRTYEDLF